MLAFKVTQFSIINNYVLICAYVPLKMKNFIINIMPLIYYIFIVHFVYVDLVFFNEFFALFMQR